MEKRVSGVANTDRASFTSVFQLDRGLVYVVIICALLLALTSILRTPLNLIPEKIFLPLHLVMELTSIVVSFAVFTTGWYGYKQADNARDLLVGVVFLSAGILDMIHTLSYAGMPSFLGAPSPGKAAAYWTLARLFVGVGLLWASMIRAPFKVRWMTPAVLFASAALIVGLFTAAVTVYDPLIGNMFFDPETKLTPLKIALEWFVIFLYAATYISLSIMRNWESRSVDLLRTALVIAIFGELAFTLYQSPFGYMNALGHVFKTTSYYMILTALFVAAVQKPYDELSGAKEELQELYVHAQEHREEIEQSFARIGSALSSSLRLDEALDQIAHLAMDMLHADCAIVASLDKTRQVVKVAAQDEGCRAVLNSGDLTAQTSAMVFKERKSILIRDLAQSGLATASCDSAGTCLQTMLCSPMIIEGHVMGMIAVYACVRNVFDEGDVKLIEGFASHAVVAMQNAISYERESRIADVLQRSVLSTTKVVTDRFEIAQVYEPAMNEALVGGDFYDVIEMPSGKIGLVIGDVSGKGLKAAVYTAIVKYSLRAYAVEDRSPAEALRLLDKILVSQTGPDTFVTMFFGVLDPETGELVYTNAGHEPPVYACQGTFLTLPPTGPALGLGMKLSFSEGKAFLAKDSTLLLYTDGISEARRDHEFLGTEGIGEQLNICGIIDGEDIAKCVHAAAIQFAGGELKDDAAILAVRATG